MSKQVTRWSPDTCGCVVEYAWDSEHPQETREHTLHKVVRKCTRHASMPDAAVYAQLTEENPRKNRVRELILDSVPALVTMRMQANGEEVADFHPDKPFAYEFDSEHVLHVRVNGMTAAARNKVQKLADAAHGPNKVLIE